MAFLLWLIAVIMFVSGVFQLASKQWFAGIALIIGAFLVGPIGVNIFGY